MKAQAIKNAINIIRVETLPNGVKVIITECVDHKDFKRLPKAVSLNGETFGLTGWNSDKFIAYFRSDKLVALSK
tara:strand:- start:369 stop:590 length:222 start_codon:yes stop_codon:yes gene_type:complete